MPLPRFVQRLFQNDGYGPKLRSEIIPWDDEKRFTALETWRQAMIGTPMPMASTTLPPGFMWADGSFAPFATYPELKAKYDAGGFTGMLLAYNASEEDIAAYPGKFKPDAANPTGLFVPRLDGLFARYCGRSDNRGKRFGPGLPDTRGYVGRTLVAGNVDNGAVHFLNHTAGQWTTYDSSPIAITADAIYTLSRANKIYGGAATVLPESVGTLIVLYLGKTAQV